MQIKVQNLGKRYREGSGQLVVLDDVSCSFEMGKSVAIVGKSGIGKSTLLHIMGGLDRPSAGQVFYDEVDLFAMHRDQLTSFRGKSVGFIFQFHHLLPEFDAIENVSMPLIITGARESEARARARGLLEEVGLADRLSHRPSQLSGGEQQRVAIARALVANPRLILADEPTGNLDNSTAAEVQDLLIKVCRTAGTTLIIVTHNLELARIMDQRYEMKPGGRLEPIAAT